MNREEAKKRAQELVAKMTVEEKASQLRYDAPAIDRLGIPAYNWWNEALHGVARAGTATMFPQAIGLAAAFDEELMGEVGEIIAEEARAKYNEQAKKNREGCLREGHRQGEVQRGVQQRRCRSRARGGHPKRVDAPRRWNRWAAAPCRSTARCPTATR